MRSGQYPPGSRLPPQRHLAVELGINVSTVSRAYKELQARGLIVASKRRGSIRRCPACRRRRGKARHPGERR